jgi:hypothetical protein
MTTIGQVPARANLRIIAGDEFPINWVWRYQNTGLPVNLSGFTAEIVLLDASEQEVRRLDTVNGRLVLGGAAGTITAKLSVSETAALPSAGLWYFRITNGTIITKASGTFSVRSRV